MSEPTIEDYYSEDRTFPPSAAFVARANVSDRSLYDEADADFEAFWARQARELVTWFDDFDTTLDWKLPDARWFDGGTLNVSYNCLDRHVEAGRGDKVAYHWEGEPGDTRTITYAELLSEVSRLANALKSLGVQRGDRVAVYLPMIPEAVVAMLACTRIGAVHSVIFGGFSPDAITDRVNDGAAVAVITSDGGYRRGSAFPLKPNVDEALTACDTVRSVIVVNRCDLDPSMVEGRDHWYHDVVSAASEDCPPEHMASEDLLYLLYTSGTTAKPKGIMHTTGGYLTQIAFTHKYVFDLKPDTDIYWCAADIGWVTGHSYVVYGPLANGATSLIYEGTPDTPRLEERNGEPATWSKDRLWDLVERYGVTQLYTAPTAIRTFMKWGSEWPARHDLTSVRVLGTVGEPINPEAWMWYHTYIGGERCPIVDTWWQTETGGHMITPLPGVTTTKPGSATFALPGVGVEVVDDSGHPVSKGGGYLTLTRPWPAMLRGIWGDPERYLATYWSTYEGRYFAGDGAKIDADGYLWLLGRVDDVMNVSGHRISTTEVESALVDHPAVAEAAVVGATDDTTGQAIVGYVILRGGNEPSDELGAEIRGHVAKKLGAIARPRAVVVVPDLPKTRSGKIMRRLLRDVAEGRALGDTTTLADPAVFDEIRHRAAESPPRGLSAPFEAACTLLCKDGAIGWADRMGGESQNLSATPGDSSVGPSARPHAVALGPGQVFHRSPEAMNLDFAVHARQSRTLMALTRVQVLPPELCDEIVADLDDDWHEGEVGTGSDDIFKTIEWSANKRSVLLQRLKVDEHQFPLGLIMRSLAEVNSMYFHFDVTGLLPSDWPSVLRYEAGRGDHYVPHVDVADEMSTRKLSFVVQLTDPTEYQGGRLELMFGQGEAATEKGWMSVFPSYRPHQVTPVTDGVRHVIVGWVHGPSFR